MSKERTSPVWKVSKDEFLQVVLKSKTLTEIANHFGLSNKGNNLNTIHRRIQEDNINIEHIYKGQAEGRAKRLKEIRESKKRDISEIFIENSSADRGSVKRRILKDNLLPYVCECCGNTGEWNNEPLSLHLDHKNGVSDDHRIENLRFLCPNCHSQTDTFSGKNNKIKPPQCIECGVDISKASKSKKCKKCQSIEIRRIERPTIEVLNRQIEEFGFSGTGRIYGVTDNAIRKWIKNIGA